MIANLAFFGMAVYFGWVVLAVSLVPPLVYLAGAVGLPVLAGTLVQAHERHS